MSLTYQYINQKDWFNGLLSFWFKPPVPYYRPNGMVWCFRPTVPHRPDGFGRLHGLRLERRGMRCLSSGTPLPCLRFCTSGCSERPHKTTARSNRGFIAVLASPAVTLRRLPKQVLLRVCRIGRTENLPAVLHVLVPRVWWPCIKDLLPLTQHWPRPLRREAAANLTCPKPSGILGLAQRGCPPKSERQRKPRLVHHEPLSVQLEPPGVHPQ